MLVLRISNFHTNVVAPKQKQEKRMNEGSVVKRNEKKMVRLLRGGPHAFRVKLNFAPINGIYFLEGMHRLSA